MDKQKIMKPQFLYDIHVATETASAEQEPLHEKLIQLGYFDDDLAERGLIFDSETAKHYASCPLIDIHMSRKITTIEELREAETKLHEVMLAATVAGYWHSEYVAMDAKIIPEEKEYQDRTFFCKPLQSQPRSENKVWDIHMALRENDIPSDLKEKLIAHGLYFLSRWKKNKQNPDAPKERFAVFTVQGISHPQDGKIFYQRLIAWMIEVGAPQFDAKMEITTRMETYRNPKAVPPTITEIHYHNSV